MTVRPVIKLDGCDPDDPPVLDIDEPRAPPVGVVDVAGFSPPPRAYQKNQPTVCSIRSVSMNHSDFSSGPEISTLNALAALTKMLMIQRRRQQLGAGFSRSNVSAKIGCRVNTGTGLKPSILENDTSARPTRHGS
ncbi:MAG: hypothetical protein Ct9H300mP16_17070 [Pseudomonadota bacterium]|nr:MAG: hypothetical protein Ct9H300mP16_17070 [Pseudomonadota bacterium]